jgi:hypothetical protein
MPWSQYARGTVSPLVWCLRPPRRCGQALIPVVSPVKRQASLDLNRLSVAPGLLSLARAGPLSFGNQHCDVQWVSLDGVLVLLRGNQSRVGGES